MDVISRVWSFIAGFFQGMSQLYSWLFTPFSLPVWITAPMAVASPQFYALIANGFAPIEIISIFGIGLAIALNIKKLAFV